MDMVESAPPTGRRPVSRHRTLLIAGAMATAIAFGAGAVALASGLGTPAGATNVEIVIRYTHFEPSSITVPVGVPVIITLRNTDPIDHEWIVGDEAVHAIHRVGTELLHPSRPTEVVIPAGESRTTTVTFTSIGAQRYICHLPGHEAYGMVGTVTIR